MWLSPVDTTHQTDRRPILLHRFSWIILNEQVKQASPKYSIRFLQALHRLLDCILEAEPALGMAYLGKVDLTNVYMLIWVLLAYIPSVDLLIPQETE